MTPRQLLDHYLHEFRTDPHTPEKWRAAILALFDEREDLYSELIIRELRTASDMAGLEMDLLTLREAAMRWEWLVRHASLGFDSAPSWNAVVRLPVFDSDDQTITALVDRARAAG